MLGTLAGEAWAGGGLGRPADAALISGDLGRAAAGVSLGVAAEAEADALGGRDATGEDDGRDGLRRAAEVAPPPLAPAAASSGAPAVAEATPPIGVAPLPLAPACPGAPITPPAEVAPPQQPLLPPLSPAAAAADALPDAERGQSLASCSRGRGGGVQKNSRW